MVLFEKIIDSVLRFKKRLSAKYQPEEGETQPSHQQTQTVQSDKNGSTENHLEAIPLPAYENPEVPLQVISRDMHSISRQFISESALKVLYRLKKSGYQAYLVGGGVRDILLGQHPKDFDITTDAHPEQVKQLFKNSRLIGRRFKLVHVQFGREIIEVATFRAPPTQAHTEAHSKSSQSGQILRDNVYGSKDEDALRRDFTVNALYYSIHDFSIHSYAGGIQDLQSKVLRLIGDPETRYREDPVRMLRAARFSAKLNFDLAPETAAPISELAPLLRNIPPARLFEEILKIFLNKHSVASYEALSKYDLFQQLFPATYSIIMEEQSILDNEDEADTIELNTEAFVHQALLNTELRLKADKTVTPAFMFAVFLWPSMQAYANNFLQQGMPAAEAYQQAADAAIGSQCKITAIPRRFSVVIRDIWDLQYRLSKPLPSKRLEALLDHPKFRAGYDFILLREEAGEDLQGLGEWWTEYQEATPSMRHKLSRSRPEGLSYQSKKRPRRRRNTQRSRTKTQYSNS